MLPVTDDLPLHRTPVAVRLFILTNALVFLFELLLGPALERLFYLFGIVPARYAHPEWAMRVGLDPGDYWPFLTSMFLHGGWVHIFGNMWTLWIFGPKVEERLGTGRFAVFYLAGGLAAGLLHFATNPDSTVPTVGASGAIAAVMGAYFVLYPYARLVVLVPILFFPLFFEVPAVLYLGVWALLQFFNSTLALATPDQVGGVAWWAHAGGFVAGIGLLPLFLLGRPPGGPRPPDDFPYVFPEAHDAMPRGRR